MSEDAKNHVVIQNGQRVSGPLTESEAKQRADAINGALTESERDTNRAEVKQNICG